MTEKENKLNTNLLFLLTLILTILPLIIIFSHIGSIPKRGIIGLSIFYPALPIVALLFYFNLINLRLLIGSFLIILILASGVRIPFLGQDLYPITLFLIYTIILGFAIIWHSILKNSYKNLKDSKIIIFPFTLLVIGTILSLPFIKDTKSLVIWFFYAIVNVCTSFVFVYSFQTYDDIMKIGVPLYTLVATLFISTVFIKPPEYTGSGMIQRYAGIYGSPNYPGIFGAFSLFLPLAAIFYVKNKIYKILYVGVVTVVVLAIIRSASRNAFLGTLVGFWIFQALFLYRNKRKKLLFFLSLLLTGIFTLLLAYLAIRHSKTLLLRVSVSTKGDLSILTRFFFWKSILNYTLQHPVHFLIGNGPLQFSSYPFSLHYTHPHNVFMDYFFSFGIFGILGLGVMLVLEAKESLKTLKNSEKIDIQVYVVKIAAISSLITFWLTSLFDEIPWKVEQVEVIYFLVPYLIMTFKILKYNPK